MCGAVEGHVGPDDGPVADADLARIENDAVEVYEDVAADAQVEAVVDGDGRLDPGVVGEERFVFFRSGCRFGQGIGVAYYPFWVLGQYKFLCVYIWVFDFIGVVVMVVVVVILLRQVTVVSFGFM